MNDYIAELASEYGIAKQELIKLRSEAEMRIGCGTDGKIKNRQQKEDDVLINLITRRFTKINC